MYRWFFTYSSHLVTSYNFSDILMYLKNTKEPIYPGMPSFRRVMAVAEQCVKKSLWCLQSAFTKRTFLNVTWQLFPTCCCSIRMQPASLWMSWLLYLVMGKGKISEQWEADLTSAITDCILNLFLHIVECLNLRTTQRTFLDICGFFLVFFVTAM